MRVRIPGIYVCCKVHDDGMLLVCMMVMLLASHPALDRLLGILSPLATPAQSRCNFMK